MEIQLLEFSQLEETHREDFITEGFVVSDNVSILSFPIYPSRINCFAVCICRAGSAVLEVNLVRYRLVPDSVLVVLPDHIIQVVESSDDFAISFFTFTQ